MQFKMANIELIRYDLLQAVDDNDYDTFKKIMTNHPNLTFEIKCDYNLMIFPPLHFAAYRDNLSLARMIIRLSNELNDPSILWKSNNDHYTPLDVAVMYGYLSGVTKLLLDNGVDPNLTTALILASERGCINIVRTLLSFPGINVNKSYIGGTALNIICKHKIPCCDEIIKLLLNHGASPNFQDSYDNTPIVNLLYADNLDMFKLMLNYGVDLSLTYRRRYTYNNERRYTLLELAISLNRDEFADAIEEYQSMPDIKEPESI
jgi:ankyrin repeat protein